MLPPLTSSRFFVGSLLTLALTGSSAAACGGTTATGTGEGGDHTTSTTGTPAGTGGLGGGVTIGASTTTAASTGAGAGTTASGTSGTGATTTASSSTSTSSSSGSTGGCSTAADCSDGFTCTVDTCTAGVCSHTVGPDSGATACPVGSFCLVGKGCVAGTVCATTAQCVTALGGDACKTNVACNPVTAVCTYTTLDNDGDGHPPVVCGGDDCNDADATIYPGAPEVCDGKDNDCNGLTDDGSTCPGLETCTAGACVCPAADLCGTACVDTQTDPTHCGTCTNVCPSGAVCTSGTCTCSATSTICSGVCVDLQTDPLNCHGCGDTCAPGYTCQAGACTCTGTSCGGVCVDTTTDPAHCGSCAGACPAGDTCKNSACVGCPLADIFILQDLSASMSTTLVSGTRLQAAATGIEAFVAETGSTFGIGLGYFPLAGNSCVTGTYAAPAVGILPLPGNASTISASIGAATVSAANTSTQAPALGGALAYVTAYESAHPGHAGAVVLITDGLPDTCTTSGVATDVAAIAASYLSATPSVKTFVVGLGTDVPVSAWNTIAAAGGTGSAIVVTDPTMMYHDVVNALDGVHTVFDHCGGGAACVHAECTSGVQLDESCSTCAAAVCEQDAFCCTMAWDTICVGEVPTFCAPKTCP